MLQRCVVGVDAAAAAVADDSGDDDDGDGDDDDDDDGTDCHRSHLANLCLPTEWTNNVKKGQRAHPVILTISQSEHEVLVMP